LKAKDYGKKCTAPVLISLLLFAATCTASLSAACRRLKRAPSDETARLALLATLPNIVLLERRLNAGFAKLLPKAFRKGTWPIAVDLWDQPYYGKSDAAVRGGPKKASTMRFHTYATAFVVSKGYRFTLAVTRVLPGEKLVAILQRLLQRVSQLRMRSRFLLLDRGFYAVDVVRYLQRARRAFVMPTKHPGRAPKDPAKAKSTRRFLVWRRSGWAEHTWTDRQGQRATVQIAVSLRRYTHRQERRRQVLVFAFWGFQPSSPLWLRETYRKRFAIESSFRQANQARIYTSTRDPARRLLFIAIALLVRNVWAWIHLLRLATAGRVHLELMPFVDMLHAIQSVTEILMGLIEIFGSPKSILASI
jgi:putative transposase